MVEGLTGLEQYSWERAGYFIRRAAVPPKLIESARLACDRFSDYANGDGGYSSRAKPIHDELGMACSTACYAVIDTPILRALAADLHPHRVDGPVVIAFDSQSPPVGWNRGQPFDETLPAAEQAAMLHRLTEPVMLLVPLGVHHSQIVMPGSHREPLLDEAAAAISLDPDADIAGSVRLRLEGGDVLAIAPGLLRRLDPLSGFHSHTVSRKIQRAGST